jgi:hypothetical protein
MTPGTWLTSLDMGEWVGGKMLDTSLGRLGVRGAQFGCYAVMHMTLSGPAIMFPVHRKGRSHHQPKS